MIDFLPAPRKIFLTLETHYDIVIKVGARRELSG